MVFIYNNSKCEIRCMILKIYAKLIELINYVVYDVLKYTYKKITI